MYFGKNSCPTMLSRTELFPELCDPITTTLGKLNFSSRWAALRIFLISIIRLIKCLKSSNPPLSSSVPPEDGKDSLLDTIGEV
jgi:hypothetical protein